MFGHVFDAVGDIPHHFVLGKVHRVHVGGAEVDVDDLFATGFHEERRLFHHIVTHINDQIRMVGTKSPAESAALPR